LRKTTNFSKKISLRKLSSQDEITPLKSKRTIIEWKEEKKNLT
jgi:hypothetical protein